MEGPGIARPMLYITWPLRTRADCSDFKGRGAVFSLAGLDAEI